MADIMTAFWLGYACGLGGFLLGILIGKCLCKMFDPVFWARECGWSWNRIIGRWPVRGRVYRKLRWALDGA